MMRVFLLLIPVLLLPLFAIAAEDDRPAASVSKVKSLESPAKELFAGQVVMLRDALKRRKIAAYEPETRNQVVLETGSGELIPIVPDWRGRAFYQDEHLRNRKVELVGYRRQGIPYLEVLMVFTFNKAGQRLYTDYWCDICSIPMYEIKPCECCQAPIRLRYQQKEIPGYIQSPAAQPDQQDVDDENQE